VTRRITEFLGSFKTQLEVLGLPLMDLLIGLLLIAVGLGSFVLGRLSASSSVAEGVRICTVEESTLTKSAPAAPQVSPTVAPVPAVRRAPAPEPQAQTAAVSTAEGGRVEGSYVASKSGKAYHLPWCPGAQRIKEENKVWFQSKEEAEAAGYSPAGNCKGL